jgi:predicted NUDIX family phosphoesterase
MSEQVMVVNTSDLAPHLQHGLIRDNTDAILDLIADSHFFIDRPAAEVSPQYRQIIPYVLIRHGDAWFTLRRTPKQTEARLHHKVSLGIGGHINPGRDLVDGMQQELDEEVAIEGDYELTFTGILNDDSTDVGRVHLGVVYVLETQSRDVRVVETEKMTGEWKLMDELRALREEMESWSQIVLNEMQNAEFKMQD